MEKEQLLQDLADAKDRQEEAKEEYKYLRQVFLDLYPSKGETFTVTGDGIEITCSMNAGRKLNRDTLERFATRHGTDISEFYDEKITNYVKIKRI